ncbi:MAG: electron transfer flavoprotein subunit alpha/FixB family protein, partial [Rhodothermales bacterium]|nr:electron transfer flavoprotein subunit alpha/FixB family protein [Rhodothermales bacterium]
MSTYLAYIATPNGSIKRSSLEVLSHVANLASRDGCECAAIVAHSSAKAIAGELAQYGASRVFVATDKAYDSVSTEGLIQLLADTIGTVSPAFVAFASTEGVKDFLGALAIKANASAIPDVSSFDIADGKVTALRPVMAAKTLARVHATTSPVLVSVRSGSYDVSTNPVESTIEEVSVAVSNSERKTIRDIVTATAGTVDLSEASVVVSAGRGVRDEEGLKLVSELTTLLGAASGATRAVVESGMFPATTQIGQTGKVVSPELYFAIGISGAIQHVAGMSNSKVIVAINKDPDAPIFNYATYGIVGDL